RILKFIKKNITHNDILQSAKNTLVTKILPKYSFIAGFPTETKEEFHETLQIFDELWEINKKIQILGIFIAVPFPGTDLYDIVLKEKSYKLPQTLKEWSKLDFAYPNRNILYLSPDLYQE